MAADLFTQKLIERKKEIDWTRNAVFATFGFGYMGCFQYWLFNIVFFKLFPGQSFKQTAKKVCCDSFIKAPFFYFPFFYMIRTFINERKFDHKTLTSIKTTYRNNIMDDLKKFWSIWIAAQMFSFGVLPIHLRLPFIGSLSFFWCCILSYLHGSYDHEQEVEVAVAAEWELLKQQTESGQLECERDEAPETSAVLPRPVNPHSTASKSA
eukprot:CAMPEP_0197035672 /NCGR_PEP_ID=MMETSP1384-20130603/13404_1 /TAXON_ID=29189 /ORGANISM="Ammonia sp." /LENGTH=208 /DNA_ID=CAMNT_0042465763 /DNA_START=159 /DNA_END=785 /DNA_ORIENTATION=+